MFIWILAALCAYFVKGLCGFANTLVFTGILSFGTDHVQISPVELLLGFPTNAILAWRERQHIRPRLCLTLSLLLLIGSTAGTLLLRHADAALVRVLFGCVIVALSLENLLRRQKGPAGQMPRAVMSLIGLFSGFLCGLYGVGALLGVYVSRVTEDSHAFKDNLCTVFLIENLYRIVLYAVTGILDLACLKQAALLLPFMLFALWAGMRSARVLKEETVRKAVMLLLLFSGLALIAQALL